MAFVYGQDVVIGIFNSETTNYDPIACARSCTFEITRDTIETSSTDSGQFRTYTQGPVSYSGSIEGLVFLGDTLNESPVVDMYNLYNKFLGSSILSMSFYELDIDGNYLRKQFSIIIESISETASFDNVTTFSANFKGSGSIDITHGTL